MGDGTQPRNGVDERNRVVDKVVKGFDGELSFELIKDDRTNRTINAIYASLDIDEYVALALKRAKKFAALMRE